MKGVPAVDFARGIALLFARVVKISEREGVSAEFRDRARRLMDRHNVNVTTHGPMLTSVAGLQAFMDVSDPLVSEAQSIVATLSQ
jgi:hypothetical protein